MALTQESVLSFLLDRGGKVKNSELVNHFKSLINSRDPAEKQLNRDLFKKLVNSVAVVKQIDQVKFVVVKKRYQDFVKEVDPEEEDASRMDRSFSSLKTSSPPPVRADSDRMGSPTQGDCDGKDVRVRRSFSDSTTLKVLNVSGDQVCRSGAVFAVIAVKSPGTDSAPSSDKAKASLPAEATNFSSCKMNSLKTAQIWENRQIESTKYPVNKTRPADDAGGSSDSVPLDPLAHEWLVKCAAGLWGQISALLLRDTRLVQRKDFMSGFTALHWAAKDGSTDVIQNLMDTSSSKGLHVDINCKSHGGYTPLHIAAMHSHAEVMGLLVQRYGANVNERDNDGKKALHYLKKGSSAEVRALLGGLLQDRDKTEDKEHTKGFNTISKLFHPHTGRKHKW